MLNCCQRPVTSETQQVGLNGQQQQQQRMMASAQLTSAPASGPLIVPARARINHYYEEQQHQNHHHLQQPQQTCNEMIDGAYQFGAQSEPQGGGGLVASSVSSDSFSNLEFNQLFANDEDEFRISNHSQAGSDNNSPTSQAPPPQQQRHGISALTRLEDALDSQKTAAAAASIKSNHQQLDHFLMDSTQSLAADSQLNMLHDEHDEQHNNHHVHHHHQRELYTTNAGGWDHGQELASQQQQQFDFRLDSSVAHQNDFMQQHNIEQSTESASSTKSAESPQTTTTHYGTPMSDYNNNGHNEHNLNSNRQHQQPTTRRRGQAEDHTTGSLSFAPLMPLAMDQNGLHSTSTTLGKSCTEGEEGELVDYYQLSQYSYEQQGSGSNELLVSSSSSSDTSPYANEHQSHNQHLHPNVHYNEQQQHHHTNLTTSNNGHQNVPNQQYQQHASISSPPQQQASFDGGSSTGYANTTNNFQDYYQSAASNYQCDQQQQQQQPAASNCYSNQVKGNDRQQQHFESHFMQSSHLVESQHAPDQQQDGRSYQAYNYNAYHQEPMTISKSYSQQQQEQVAPPAAAITTTRSSNASSEGDLLVASQLSGDGANHISQPVQATFIEADKSTIGQQQTKITTTGFSRGRQMRGRPRKKKSSAKGKVSGKLWEFIRDLLLSECTNPSFIRWERREDGVFKFVQSDKVAKMWGERKQNPKMTYEKLSRAMRYYYKSKVLLPVFGRRLVYKFGPNATGWMSVAQQQQFDQNKLQQQQQQLRQADESTITGSTQLTLTGACNNQQQQHPSLIQHHSQQPSQQRIDGFY